jgi:hypothetical protein
MGTYLSAREAAKLLGVSSITLRRHAVTVAGEKVDGRWIFPRAKLADFVKRPPGRPPAYWSCEHLSSDDHIISQPSTNCQ